MVVFGQDSAIETLSNCIKMSRSGLGNTERPIGSFLFAGPTGVENRSNYPSCENVEPGAN